jgi:hypothetical protein
VRNDHSIPDPHLTGRGREQARTLIRDNPRLESLDAKTWLIAASPFRRALETTLIGFGDAIKSGVPLEILPQVSWTFFFTRGCMVISSDAAQCSLPVLGARMWICAV